MIVRVAAEFKHDHLIDRKTPAKCIQLIAPALRRADDVGTNKRVRVGKTDALSVSIGVGTNARDRNAGPWTVRAYRRREKVGSIQVTDDCGIGSGAGVKQREREARSELRSQRGATAAGPEHPHLGH